MKRFAVVCAMSALVVFGAAACKSGTTATPPATQAQPAGAAAPAAAQALSGKVVETMNAGGYTYMNLENNGQHLWVAMPATQVKVGQLVTCQPGMMMQNFTSPTMKRTFESIYFSGGLL